MTGERAIGTLFDLDAETPSAWRDPVDGATPATRAGLEVWRGYEVGDDDATIRAAFRARFGSDPALILRQSTIALAGPIPAGGAS
jgi:hypothetical protein